MNEIKDLLVALIPTISGVLGIIITVIASFVKLGKIRKDNETMNITLKKKIEQLANINAQYLQQNLEYKQIIAHLQECNNEYKEYLLDTVTNLNEMIHTFEDDIAVCTEIKKDINITRKKIEVMLNENK